MQGWRQWQTARAARERARLVAQRAQLCAERDALAEHAAWAALGEDLEERAEGARLAASAAAADEAIARIDERLVALAGR